MGATPKKKQSERTPLEREQRKLTPAFVRRRWKALDRVEIAVVEAILANRSRKKSKSGVKEYFARMDHKQLEEGARYSKNTVRAAIGRLEKKGIIEIISDGKHAGATHKNRYRIHDSSMAYKGQGPAVPPQSESHAPTEAELADLKARTTSQLGSLPGPTPEMLGKKQ